MSVRLRSREHPLLSSAQLEWALLWGWLNVYEQALGHAGLSSNAKSFRVTHNSIGVADPVVSNTK